MTATNITQEDRRSAMAAKLGERQEKLRAKDVREAYDDEALSVKDIASALAVKGSIVYRVLTYTSSKPRRRKAA
jgi:DNA invertase Pin-like site-specific DNA recombinase